MADGASTTRENWAALRRLAELFLLGCRRANPDWSYADLRCHLNLPDTFLIRTLAEEAGFGTEAELTLAEENRILRLVIGGTRSLGEIAEKTGIALEAVRDYLGSIDPGYGGGGYGVSPFPSALGKSMEYARSVPNVRRISAKGQLCFEGHTYGLGMEYARQICWIEKLNAQLIIHLAGGTNVTLRA